MMRKILRNGGLLALVLPLFCGVALAGADCDKTADAKGVHKAEVGSHCHLGMTKNIKKTARMTDDGAVVIFAGKTDEAVTFVKNHLGKHGEAADADCGDCPMGMDGVSAQVTLTDKGGEVTLAATDKAVIEKVQRWAQNPAACCEKGEKI